MERSHPSHTGESRKSISPIELALLVMMALLSAGLAIWVFHPDLIAAREQAKIIKEWEDPLPWFPHGPPPEP